MPPPLAPSHSIRDLLRGAALAHLEQAVSLLSVAGPIPPAAVHETRRSVKRIRAVLRLVRGDLGPRFADWNGRLQSVNRQLSSTRDLDVCLMTIQELPTDSSAPQRQLLDQLQTELTASRTTSAVDLTNDRLQSLVEELKIVARGITDWNSDTVGFALIHPAVRDMVKNARRRIERLDERSRSDDIHALRKIVKLRLYWLEFLQPIWPRGMRAENKLVDSLADDLGRHHDLVVLEELLLKSAVGKDSALASAVEQVLRQIRCRQCKLLSQGLKLARRLFAERPKAFTRRWETWAEIWRTSLEPTEPASPSQPTTVRVRPR